jgi:hypothetical protein
MEVRWGEYISELDPWQVSGVRIGPYGSTVDVNKSPVQVSGKDDSLFFLNNGQQQNRSIH